MEPQHLSPSVVDLISAIPVAIGAVVITIGSVQSFFKPHNVARRFAEDLTLGLEFFLAAGLLRLATVQDLESMLLVVSIIVVRTVIRFGIRAGVQAAED